MIDSSKIQYLFLDRDGVLNRKPPNGGYVTRWEEFALLPGVADALAALNRSGRKAIVVTNQRGIALGLYSADDLAAIHERLQATLSRHGAHLDAIYVCPHDNGQCDCRKPLPGLFQQALRDFPAATPANSLMVGDSLSDMEAAVGVGMNSVLVTSEGSRKSEEQVKAEKLAVLTVSSLPELVEDYLCPGKRQG